MDNNMRFAFIIVTASIFLYLNGCSAPHNGTGEEYLVRIGDRVVTVADFSKAFEIAKTAYPQSSMQNPVNWVSVFQRQKLSKP